MAELTVLGNSAVHELLISLQKNEILAFQKKLEGTLRAFSVDAERQYQPEPGVVKRPNGQKTLFRAFTSSTSVGTKIIVTPAPETVETSGGRTERNLPLKGVLVMCDQNGCTSGLINAEEVTGYRTSLSALIGFGWRSRVDNIVIFGAGKQALWHLRLALTLRGEEVRKILLINRSRERAQSVVDTLETERRILPQTQVAVLDQSAPDYEKQLQNQLSEADAIFCTVPSKEVLFSEQAITMKTGRRPYISAIGSWTPDMIELDPELLKRSISDENAFNPFGGDSKGVIVVDDRDSALTHTGEFVQSGLDAKQMVELGEVVDIRDKGAETPDNGLVEWLKNGFVVYKSVGVGLTDRAAGEAILELARVRGVGQKVLNF